MGLKKLLHGEYTIGWICALPLEQTAAMYMLDERHQDLQNPLSDENTYTLGKIGGHNVVIVGLPKGRIGTNDSAAVITRMASTFPNIKFGMMVGVGGGIPDKTRLGDVVICSALGTSAGVVQHDMGTRAGDHFETRGFLSGPPTAVLTALAKFQADPRTPGQIRNHLDDMAKMPYVDESYLKSDSLEDLLFESDYSHVDMGGDCSSCDRKRIKPRAPRRTDFKIHYGLIASGNTKVKDAKLRDELCKRYKNNLYCIEMEAAGLMNNFPCVVIRGICDYADSHASKEWQNYAAAVAAACTKTLLGVVPEREVRRLQSVQDSVVSSNTETSREYDRRHHADSPPPSPQEFEGTAAPALRMIGGPSTNYYSNLSGTAYSGLGEPHYNANDLIRPLGEAFANLFQGGSRRAHVTEETIDAPQTPPRSPKRANPGYPRRQEDGSGARRKTDLGTTQLPQDGDLPDTPKLQVVNNNTFPRDKHSSTASTAVNKHSGADGAAFFKAIESEDIASIERQLQNGADLEMVNEFSCTPLWYAVLTGKRTVIQLLLDKGANIEAKNFHGQNLLAWAVSKERTDIVEMLGYN